MIVSLRRYSKYSITLTSIFAVLLISFLSQVAFAQTTASPTTSEEVSTNIVELEIAREIVDDPESIPQGDFVVGPGKTELTVPAGEYRVVEILITNRTGEERIFNLVTEDAAGTDDPEVPVQLLGAERGPYTLKDYLEFPEAQITLSHNERARVPVVVRVPSDAEPGGLYGSVIVTTASSPDAEDTASGAAPRSAVVSRIGSLFFVTVPGDIDVNGELVGFDTLPSKKLFWKGPIHFQILYKNNGSLHLNPYGELRITNMLGEEVGFVELDPWFVLPNALRSREIEWNREFLIGRYTATTHINRGYEDIVDTQEVVFWVIPWKVIVVTFVGLFIFFFTIRFITRNFELKRKV